MQTFKTITENQSYLGDMVDFFGKRIALIVHKGVAVFAQCPVEKHYLFKEDFEAIAETLDFVYAADIQNGAFEYSNELDKLFDQETIQSIYEYLVLSLSN